MVQRAAIYARVSTDDQSCSRQVAELKQFAQKSGVDVIAIVTETASGAKNNRQKRQQVIELARKRDIDLVLVSELSRWGRSTQDLLQTIHDLAARGVALRALNGAHSKTMHTARNFSRPPRSGVRMTHSGETAQSEPAKNTLESYI